MSQQPARPRRRSAIAQAASKSPASSKNGSSTVEILGAGRFLRLVRRGRWEYAERVNATGAVVIVALTAANQVLFTEQWREPVQAKVLEMPAGLMGDVSDNPHLDTWKDAARRELLEEAGYQARSIKFMAEGPVSAGFGTEAITMVLATGLTKVAAGGGIDGEDITVHEVPLDNAVAWLNRQRKKGYLVDPKVYAGLFFASQHVAG